MRIPDSLKELSLVGLAAKSPKSPKGLPMRITAFIGAALIALCSLAMAPVAMADPAPDICVLDLASPVDHVYDAAPAGAVCSSPFIAVKPVASLEPGGNDDEAAGPAGALVLIALDFASYRQHFDPGRDLA